MTKYGAECPLDVDNECLSDQECSAGRKCCPSPYDDEACQLLCLEPVPQSKKPLEPILLKTVENRLSEIGTGYGMWIGKKIKEVAT